jgi:chromosomal replication initiation ATPase DnaA
MDQITPSDRLEFSDDEATLLHLYAYLERHKPTMAEIKRAICELYAIEISELEGRSRTRFLVLARQIFCYLSHRYARKTLGQIKRRVGYTDHTTVLHAIRVIEQYAVTREQYRYEDIERPMIKDDLDLLRLRLVEKVVLRRTGGGQC